jgi:hypothetical protein
MRLALLLIAVLFVAGCGASMAQEKPAAETATARIVVSWDGDPTKGVFDLRDGTGVVDGAILTVDAVYHPIEKAYYVPIEKQPAGARGKRWLKSPREDWDPFLLAPLADEPEELLAFLGTAERGEAVGEGEERGEPVTYYTATVRMEEFIAAQAPDRRAELEEVYVDWEGMVFQLALDSEGRFRRAEVAFPEQEVLLIEIFDYGVAVDARAPDPSTVLTWAEYEKLLLAECERLKEQGREKELPHCYSCGVAEGEA